jgi:hypothetical protein
VNDSQAHLAIGRRPRCARRGVRGLGRTESLLRDDPLHFDVREAGVPLLAYLDDGSPAVSSNRRNDLYRGGAGSTPASRTSAALRNDPPHRALDRDEVDDASASHDRLMRFPRSPPAIKPRAVGARSSSAPGPRLNDQRERGERQRELSSHV